MQSCDCNQMILALSQRWALLDVFSGLQQWVDGDEMGRSILRKKGSLGGAILDGKKGLESADMHVVSGLNGVTHISTVQEMPDSKMAAVDLPAHVGSLVLVPAAGSLEQDGDRPNKKVNIMCRSVALDNCHGGC